MVRPSQIINAMRDIEAGLQRFSILAANELQQVELIILGWEHTLQQRQTEVEREYEAARTELNICLASGFLDDKGNYHPPNCTLYEIRFHEVQQTLTQIYRLITLLTNVTNQYHTKVIRLQEMLDGSVPTITYWLREREQALESFERSDGGFGVGNSSGRSLTIPGETTSGFGSGSYDRIDHGIINIAVSELPDPDFDENDFSPKGITVEDMQDGVGRLQEIQKTMESGKGLDGDYWSQIDRERGLSNPRSYRNAYDAFWGSQPVRVERVNGKYDIIGGRHRVWVAKKMGITHIPVRVIELTSKT